MTAQSTSAIRIRTKEEFQAHVAAIEGQEGYKRPQAFALGLATVGRTGKVLDTYYPVVNANENHGSAAVLAELAGHLQGSSTYALSNNALRTALDRFAPYEADAKGHPNICALHDILNYRISGIRAWVIKQAVVTFIDDLSTPPTSVEDAYLRLHLLSNRKVRPHGLNLDGIFALLPNVVWTNVGPFEPEEFDRTRLHLQTRCGEISIHGVDKFPRMTDYVVPPGVRIADANRVRLGAYLAEGTTVMQEGFCNFNAGTLGKSMIEGRISAGVVVGNGTDIGGGASIMGTLSGGGKEVIKIGENCLLGANSGLGISLDNGCTVEAGLYVTAGSKVTLPDRRVVKALALSGQDDLLFRRNSQTGAIEVLAKRNQVVLNPELHAN